MPFGTRYWVTRKDNAKRIETYQRLPPSVSMRGARYHLKPTRWYYDVMGCHTWPVEDVGEIQTLETLHSRRVLSRYPTLLIALWEWIGVPDLLRLIIELFTAISL
jgi:hypothetical protein